MADDRSIRVRLLADIANYRQGMSQAAQLTTKFGHEVGSALGKLSGQQLADAGSNLNRHVTLPLLAMAGAASKVAIDFSNTFNQMQGLAGVAAEEVGALRDEVLSLAGQTGRSPQELAEGLYFVRSAGIDGAEAMQVLRASAKGAASGLGSTASVADLLTSVLGAYGEANITAAEAADVLTATAREGKAEAASLAPQMGRLLPIASELGVEFHEVGGALAYLSRSGGGAELASTNLGNVLQKLLTPAQEGVTALEEIGLTTDDLRASIADRGLLGTLVMLRETLEANGMQLGDFSRDAQFTTGVLGLTANGGRDAQEVFDALDNSVGSAADAFQAAAQGPGFELRQSMADVQVAAIELGDAIAPIAADLAGGVGNVASAFASIPGPAQVAVLGVLGLAAGAGPVLTLVGNIQRVQEKLREVGPAGERAAAGVGKLGKAAGGAVGIAALAFSLEAIHDAIENALQEDAPSLDAMGLALVEFAQNASASGALIDAFGSNLSGLADDLKLLDDRRSGFHIDIFEDFDEAVGRIDSVDKALAQLVDSGHGDVAAQVFDDLTATFAGTGVTAADLRAELGDYESALDRAEAQQRLTEGSTGQLSESLQLQQERTADLVGALEDYENRLRAMSDPLFGMVDAVLQANEAQLAYQDSLAGVTRAQEELDAAIGEHGAESAEAAEASRNLQQANLDLERSLYGTAEASLNLDSASQALATAVANGETSAEAARAELERMAGQSGQTADQINELIARFEMLVASVDGRVLDFTVNERHRVFGAISANTPVLGVAGSQHADGGRIHGPGTLTGMGTDTVAAALTPDEFVINARSARAIGYGALERLNRVGFADGGIVGGALDAQSARTYVLANVMGSAAGRSFSQEDFEAYEADINSLTDAYLQLANSIGRVAADQILFTSQNREHFDQLAAAAEDAADRFEVMFEVGAISRADYLAGLKEQLAGQDQFSDGWYSTWQKILKVEQDALREQESIEDARYELGLVSRDERRAVLEARLADEELYSARYVEIQRELRRFDEEEMRRRTELARARMGELAARRADVAAMFLEAQREAAETGEDFRVIMARLQQEAAAAAALQDAADRYALRHTPLTPSDPGGWTNPGAVAAWSGVSTASTTQQFGFFGDVTIQENVDWTSTWQQVAVARTMGTL